MASTDGDQEIPKSKRLFINCVDAYQGKNLAKFLSNCVVGSSLDEAEEEEEDDQSVTSDFIPPPKEGCYEIIGTLKDKDAKKPDFVKEIINYQTKEQLYEHLIECDIIVYDVTGDADQIDEATWAVSELHSDLEKIDSQKSFILISSVMTWARSKPLDPDDPEIPFTEDDYRRRKPHPNFKEHISAEKTVIKLGKTNKAKLVTYVVASGLTYGCGENIFHYLFKAAWHNAPELHVFGSGQNVVPTIHIKDLAGVIQNIADSRPKVRYLVAVDDSQTTLEEIVKVVSTNLGTGKIKNISKEEALLNKDIDQADYDQLLVNLRMDAVFVKENMRVAWVAESGIPENVAAIVKEYRTTRGLLPIKACILGPPASGKTFLITELTKTYKTHHIKITEVINEAVTELLEKYSSMPAEELEALEDDEDKRLYERIQHVIGDCRERNEEAVYEEILDDVHIIRYCKDKLHSMPCQNQGFILDGFPKTLDQAKDLFSVEEMEESTVEESKGPAYDVDITPEYVFILEATDEFLKERVFAMSQLQLAASYKTDSSFSRLLVDYRDSNPEDEPNPIAAHFKELEIEAQIIDLGKDKSNEKLTTSPLTTVTGFLGESRTYEQTNYEKRSSDLAAAEEDLKVQNKDELEVSNKKREERLTKEQRREALLQHEADDKNAEINVLIPKVLPMRNFLMRAVMPTLIEGLIECVKHRPENGIDHLAEYIFKHNPQECYMPEEEEEIVVTDEDGETEGVESMEEEVIEFMDKELSTMSSASMKSTPVSSRQS